MGRWSRWVVVAGAGLAVVVGVAGWYAADRTGPRDAGTAGERLRADTQTLVAELGLEDVSPDISADRPAGEECAIWQGDQQLTEGPHLQHRVAYRGRPPDRAVAELRPDAERILRRLGYRIITDRVNFEVPPPDGLVIATWGWSDVLEITLWPEPDDGTVRIWGQSSCLPDR